MNILPYYVLVGVGTGFAVVLFLQNVRLALHFLWTVGKAAVVLLAILLLGQLLGLWNSPRAVVVLFFGLRRLWEPFQVELLTWIRGVLL